MNDNIDNITENKKIFLYKFLITKDNNVKYYVSSSYQRNYTNHNQCRISG